MDENTELPVDAKMIFPRILFGGVGFIFAAIGVTVIGFLWMTPFNEFHSPPLFFRVFGSLVASMFVLMGGGIGYAAVTGNLRSTGMKSGPRSSQAGYTCPVAARRWGRRPTFHHWGMSNARFASSGSTFIAAPRHDR